MNDYLFTTPWVSLADAVEPTSLETHLRSFISHSLTDAAAIFFSTVGINLFDRLAENVDVAEDSS